MSHYKFGIFVYYYGVLHYLRSSLEIEPRSPKGQGHHHIIRQCQGRSLRNIVSEYEER